MAGGESGRGTAPSAKRSAPAVPPGRPMIAQGLVVPGALRSEARMGGVGERRGGPGAARCKRGRL
jgi:hypothetical protein